MEHFHGKLLRDGQAVAEGVDGRLTVEQIPGRPERWSGFFTMPTGVPAQLNDQFELSLPDGRSVKIRLERVNSTAQGTFVSFGSLE